MDRYSLQFQGTRDWTLLACLLAAVTALLAGYAAWQFLRRRWRRGVLSASAALTPVALVPTLLADAWLRYRAGDARGGRASWLAAVMAAAGTTVAAGLVVAAGKTAEVTWLAVLTVQTAIAIGVFYSVVHARLGSGRLAALVALRCVALAALLVLLFKPTWSIAPADGPPRPALAVLVDRSGSMATAEAALPSRYAQAMQMLADQQQRIERTFEPQWRHFAAGVEQADSLSSLAALAPAGPGTDATDIAGALRAAGARGGHVGVLLISDGIDNAAQGALAAAAQVGAPVYVAAVGSLTESASLRRNIEIASVDAPMTATAGSAVSIAAEIRLTGLANSAAEVRLLAADTGELLDTAALWADTDSETAHVEFTWQASDLPAGADDAATTQRRSLALEIAPLPGEVHQADNRRDLHVVVTHPSLRVLYVEGTIRPEYKWLRRLLAGDRNVELVSMVRIDERRFWSRGSADGRELTGLPRSDEDFAAFDVIILGDLDSSFLTTGQMDRLERFVADGGGLAMLGGHNSFGPGGYGGSPVERTLPVVVGTRAQQQASAPFGMQLTAAGQAHPIFADIAELFAGPGGRPPSTAGRGLPLLSGCVAVVRAKDAAATLAVNPLVENAAGPLVVVAVQAYGRGRSAALTADTTWRWRLASSNVDDNSPYEQFWGQLVRWLAREDARTRRQAPAVVMRMDRQHVSSGQEVTVFAKAVGPDADAAATARGSCDVLTGEADEMQVVTSFPLTPDGKGGFTGRYAPGDSGDYTLRATVTTGEGKELGTDELPLTVAAAPAEMQTLARNDGLLRQIAQRTGGQFADIAGLPDLIDEMLAAHRRAAGEPPKPGLARMYDFPSLFVVFVAAVTAEWIARRRWQLR